MIIMKEYLRNPIILWIKWLWQKIYLETVNRSKKLKIGYLSFVDNLKVGNYNTIYEYVIIKNVELGDFTYISKNSEIMNTNIGKFCSIGEQSKIGLGIHPINYISTHPIFYSIRKQSQISFTNINLSDEYKETCIGNDVWVGARVLIIDGVTIGNGAIIAAGSIVTKDVPAYAIVAGVPARVIRYRFSEEEYQKLEELKWWDKDIEWLRSNQAQMCDPACFFKELT